MDDSEHLSSLQEMLNVSEVSMAWGACVHEGTGLSVDLAATLRVDAVNLPMADARVLPAFERSLQPQARELFMQFVQLLLVIFRQFSHGTSYCVVSIPNTNHEHEQRGRAPRIDAF